MNNSRVMAECNIQLPDINRKTLTQWYNNKQKKREAEVLLQGIRITEPAMASSQPLPPAKEIPCRPPVVNFPTPLTFILPANTTGEAKLRLVTPRAEPLFRKPTNPAPSRIQLRPNTSTQHHQLALLLQCHAAKGII
uniref:Uncharacterized protein n=2 Tax=Ciona intestinalis TaxID=7719 RepID=H2XL30_CIOIN